MTSVHNQAIEEAAQLAEGQADLYAAYATRAAASAAKRGGRGNKRIAEFQRDGATCRELARLIRSRLTAPDDE